MTHTTVDSPRVAAPRRIGARSDGMRRPRPQIGRHALLLVLALFTLFPVLLVISTTLKTPEDVRVNPFGFFSTFSLQNIVDAWTVGRFSDYLWNSILLTVPSTLFVVLFSTMAGYTFARLPFRGRTILFYIVVLGLLVPFFTYMIPLYFQLRSMGLLDTLLGAVLLLTSGGLSFGTFFMRAFFSDLPVELEQAARVDGASELQIFLRVMMPLARSGMGALAVFTFLGNWNNFLIPLLYLPGGDFRPLTSGLYMFTGGRSLDIGPLAAGTLITILPVIVLFIVLQRQVTQGFLAGAVKG
ncbi:multiple sugar transport system permease protein/raffinose/stachyose/melibiose transport system permease protein [Diaminobutyricimonas aerilata]|uniref:Multiple sugar transport system permease protein/raffinose/stachyose/melibiose transport system permease protein n=1 Tax=Diaminobutyricimonas aerilata TaxID=1162967 RepID=A0A2M9CFT4_9MICO|nr:carbohydrate ABC transporter permease [Diaminobutyricimonas aerilata]PJJ70705.1 multiple sugar transport system permease protein/raffinose/stachyose/melibiose transport system permease protein [Diaminobutyricimonas aerilata]